jgi:tetratricopeptide (TPR) repeat protein
MIESILKENAREVNRLLRFLTRDGSGGVLFAVAKDYRIIPTVNAYLMDKCKESGVIIHSFNLTGETSQDSFGAIIKLVIDEAQGLIITNLDLLIFKGGQEAQSTGILSDINYSREAVMQLRKPILIWLSPDGFLAFQRLAVDFYTQRAGNTVFFDKELITDKIEYLFSDSFGSRNEEALAQNQIVMLNMQLKDALDSNQSKARIANHIVLELLENYATAQERQAYRDLYEKYKLDFDFSNPYISGKIATSYFEVNGIGADTWRLLSDALEKNKADNLGFNVANILLCIFDMYDQDHPDENAFQYLYEALEWLRKDIFPSTNFTDEEEFYKFRESFFDFYYPLILSRFGNTYSKLNKLPEALISYEKLYDLQQKWVKKHPDSADSKYWLASACSNLGETHFAMGNLPKAIAYFEQRLTILTTLHEEHPNELDYHYNLTITYEKLAETYLALGSKAQAQEAFEQLLHLSLELVEAYPNDMHLKNDLAKSYFKYGTFCYYDLKDREKATNCFKRAYQLWNELKTLNLDFVHFSKIPNDIILD